MERIRAIVNGLMHTLAEEKEAAPLQKIEAALKKVLTKKQIQHIRIDYFHKGTVRLEVDSSSWLYWLSLQRQDLLEAMQKALPQVKDIRFTLGEMK